MSLHDITRDRGIYLVLGRPRTTLLPTHTDFSSVPEFDFLLHRGSQSQGDADSEHSTIMELMVLKLLPQNLGILKRAHFLKVATGGWLGFSSWLLDDSNKLTAISTTDDFILTMADAGPACSSQFHSHTARTT